MDIQQPQTTNPISDDQELAKVLAGVSQDSNNLNYEETLAPVAPVQPETIETIETIEPIVPVEPITPFLEPAIIPDSSDLVSIKKDAISELRPLVDRLNLEPEEKFDTYLLLLRSTDDKTLIGPAHLAAQSIADETRRAQALLDIIKEIDFLSAPQQAI